MRSQTSLITGGGAKWNAHWTSGHGHILPRLRLKTVEMFNLLHGNKTNFAMQRERLWSKQRSESSPSNSLQTSDRGCIMMSAGWHSLQHIKVLAQTRNCWNGAICDGWAPVYS